MIPTRKTKIIFWFMVIMNLLIIFVGIFSLIEIDKKRSNISTIASEIQLELEKEEKLKLSKDILKSVKIRQNEMDSCFIQDDGVVVFIEHIETLADKTEVVLGINSVSIDDYENEKKNNFFEKIELNFEVKGLWEDVFYFLTTLENSGYRVGFDGLTLSKETRREEDLGLWRGVFNIEGIKEIKK